MGMIEQFERLLASGQDSALLRFGLGSAYLQAGDPQRAVEHLRAAVTHDPGYSAAWKALGKALTAVGQLEDAGSAYAEGIRIAEGRGDIQAAREMKVFLKRLGQG
jgi:Tfp pilus assembly protein PilF